MIDTHCHLTDPRLEVQLGEVLARAEAAGVGRMITVGTDLADDRQCVALCRGRENLRCAIGVHPHQAAEVGEGDMEELRRLQGEASVVAIGEIGLDYHYDFSPRVKQGEIFEKQMQLAGEVGKPVVIHCREAMEDCMKVMRRFEAVPALFHCFTGNRAEAEEIVAAGYYMSFAGVVTFKKTDELREAVKVVPMDRLLVETDSPYLAPEPFRRQKVNEPAMVVHTAAMIARIKEVSVEEIERITTENAERFFGW